ncbi:MAG TPA: hypothetical protein VHM19_21520, partial [Polyangiales bacterium]|nr:hypothetical protein [Polyangiales bacterium]
MISKRLWRLSCVLVVCSWCACQCNDKTPVPFKREDQAAKPANGDTQAAVATATGAQAAQGGIATYPEGTTQLTLEGASAQRAQGAFRASLAVDLDGDAIHDALLVTTDAQGKPQVEAALRRGDKLELGSPIALAGAAAASCSVGEARIAALGSTMAVVTTTFSCTEKAPAAAPAPANAANTAVAAAPREHHYVFALEAAPRQLLHVSLRNAADTTSAPHFGLSLATEDHDTDEHPDVRLDLDLENPGGPPRKLSLLWLDRPSGLARDGTQPDQMLATLSTEAATFLPKNPEQALAAVNAALALHAGLCRESGHALLEIDDEPGVVCGPSPAAGRIAVTRVSALARARDIVGALDAYAQLSSPAYKVDDAQHKRADRALASLPGDTDYTWFQGPALRAPDSPAVRLPALGFIDEGHLLLRGVVAQSYELATKALVPIGLSGSVLVSDAQQHDAVIDVVRGCDGRHLRMAPAEQVMNSVAASLLTGNAGVGPLLDVATASDAPCVANAPVKSDRTGLSVLGYSAQGVLVAQGSTLLLVAVNAAAGTPARALAPDEAAPILVAPGALAADGLHHALASSQGVVLVTRGAHPGVRLVRTPPSCSGVPSDVALSPSGEHIAMLCGGTVYVAAHAGAAGAGAATDA